MLSEIAQMEDLPEVIVIDNGPEFISNALDAWVYQRRSSVPASQLRTLISRTSTAD